ncbi:MAG: glycoside hydrolase family 3 C-terminal domain-containing protein [Parafannyhessea umbonata]|uniref:glycoside hydrolase family 3 C-terminal domain-containing protein n=1 Tax=Parafannyhessea umbonata TaxID=604330 RepID=UPI0026F1F95C|nr:glycoside hydrolase family 3 C-terminal domain-containing protein [Parafannyhessea umbonata]MDD6359789.1 glycoside hydrolase family 3 C-terminal domain-containing protein [Parafannyhessea umbonata]MDD6565835.1 glycoside hydrolase family 3 C-terminal domain-containing protein [Parafannyhessea umbonata]
MAEKDVRSRAAAAPLASGGEPKPAKQVKRPKRVLFVLMIALSVLVVGVTGVVGVVVSPYFDLATTFMTKPDMSSKSVKKASAATRAVTEQVEGEAIVLLKNQDGALPLSSTGKVNVFGSTADNNFSYGGTGSGSGDASKNVTLYQGLKNAGLKLNPELVKFYQKSAKSSKDMGRVGTDWNLYELPQAKYDQKLIDNAKSYSDTALVVLTRKGGEGFDLPTDMASYKGSEAGRSYLQLTPNEEDLLAMAKANFKKVVVVLNSPNTMELGFLNDPKIQAAIWVGTPGSTGCNAIGKVLTGAVNPSGRTVDTFAYDLKSAPSYYNFGAHDYSNVKHGNNALFAGTGDATSGKENVHWVDYAEGIYVGYRYYETAAADGYIDYSKTVQFPFGYGLSYTSFDEKIKDFSDDGTNVTMTVSVTNAGKVSGKDVVEGYYSAPYTKGGIEKSAVVLGGFAKTKLLEPGETQDVKISWTHEDMASYDYTHAKSEKGAYVLEAGDYQVSLRRNSHDVVDTRTVHVDRDYVFDDAHDGKRASDKQTATNEFDDVSNGDGITYLSRADWKGTFPTMAPATKKASAAVKDALDNPAAIKNPKVNDVTYGAKNGLELKDMKGLSYDDKKWDKLLDQMTLKEQKMLVGNAGWMTFSAKSVGKPAVVECDGPNGLNNIMAGYNGTQLAGQSTLGMTWNARLAQKVGELFAKEAHELKVAGLYAPGADCHRSAFGGRNYEYVSEDGLLTGKIVAAEVRGIQDNGVYCYLKHFALNDQETHRCDAGGLVTWANEQAMREIYLKPFEIAVKEAHCRAMMSSYNKLGTTPAAESYALLTKVLRGEWGFRGSVVTDCILAADTTDINRGLRAGNDLYLSFLQNTKLTKDTLDTPAGHQALRRAAHNVLYTEANSDAASVGMYGQAAAITAAEIVDAAVIALLATYFVRRHKKMVKWRAQEVAAGRLEPKRGKGDAK